MENRVEIIESNNKEDLRNQVNEFLKDERLIIQGIQYIVKTRRFYAFIGYKLPKDKGVVSLI